MADENRPIIIKKIKKVEGHGHHGGAWKVAYADFVTAMMAFFLLLWLLSSTTDEQKQGIAEYFNPTLALTKAGAGTGVMGGTTPEDGISISAAGAIAPVVPTTSVESANNDDERFKEAEAALKQAIQDVPELKDLADSLLIDNTPEGMRIQIVDQDRRSMFPSGSSEMFDYTKKLVSLVAQVVTAMPNKIALGGHTDAVPFRSGDYTNWELSSDRANALRKQLIAEKIPQNRISRVSGYADRELLDKEDPKSSHNRRISILLLREDEEKSAPEE